MIGTPSFNISTDGILYILKKSSDNTPFSLISLEESESPNQDKRSFVSDSIINAPTLS